MPRRTGSACGRRASLGGRLGPAAGSGKICTIVPGLVDTNVVVYRFHPRFPRKQHTATALLRRGLAEDQLRIPHQAIVEFVAVVARPLEDGAPRLSPADAPRQATGRPLRVGG